MLPRAPVTVSAAAPLCRGDNALLVQQHGDRRFVPFLVGAAGCAVVLLVAV